MPLAELGQGAAKDCDATVSLKSVRIDKRRRRGGSRIGATGAVSSVAIWHPMATHPGSKLCSVLWPLEHASARVRVVGQCLATESPLRREDCAANLLGVALPMVPAPCRGRKVFPRTASFEKFDHFTPPSS